MKEDNINSIFVYGTLKEGGVYDRDTFVDNRLSVEPARITGSIYDMGTRPVVKLDGNGIVRGEIHTYHARDLEGIVAIMDSIENYDKRRAKCRNKYNRKIVTAKTEAGREIKTYVYEYSKNPTDDTKIHDGIWEPYRNKTIKRFFYNHAIRLYKFLNKNIK